MIVSIGGSSSMSNVPFLATVDLLRRDEILGYFDFRTIHIRKKFFHVLKILEECRVSMYELLQERLHDLSHLRVRSLVASEREDMPPLSEIRGHHDLGLETVRKNGPGLLRAPSLGNKR